MPSPGGAPKAHLRAKEKTFKQQSLVKKQNFS